MVQRLITLFKKLLSKVWVPLNHNLSFIWKLLYFLAMLLPLSLQQIASWKNHTVQSNELAKGYTLITMTIFIDKYWRETHTRRYRFFWSMRGAFCHYSLVCALFHTQGSKAHSKSNKSLKQKLYKSVTQKLSFFEVGGGRFIITALCFQCLHLRQTVNQTRV